MGSATRSARDVNRAYFKRAYQTGVHGWGVDTPDPWLMDFLEPLSREYPAKKNAVATAGSGTRI